ncbi:MAG TPA: hypothetical protein ENK18_06020 [Deltaproteobacteria bacterium]|nr:hypothetical protein [Deltaproteobacteria bacterium]
MPTTEIVGAWISIFLTLCIFSYLYDDNPIYKLVEHLFLGVSIGYSVVEAYFGAFKPNVINKLADGQLTPLVALVLVLMLFSKVIPRFSYLARIPIAFIVAAFAGVKLTGEANSNLMTQVAQSMPNLAAVYAEHGLWSWDADGAGLFSSLFLVAGLSACLLHFYFSAPHQRGMKVVSRFGVLVLMLSFGASFGYTVMGRISLCIGRVQEMLGLNRPIDEAEIIQPQLATLVSLVVIVGSLVVWRVQQSRQRGAEG